MACQQQQQHKVCGNSEMQRVHVSCKQHPKYALAVREGKVKMLWFKGFDETQEWERVGLLSAGGNNFCLVNKATGQAIAHPNAEKEEVYLVPYNANSISDNIVWTRPLVGDGLYDAVQNASDRSLYLDLFGGVVGDASRVGMYKLNGGANQLWSMSILPVPLPGPDPCPCP